MGDLTSRELEVAGLVLAGLTHRQIAGRLAIRKRTADTHVEHVYSKLGISSRDELAAALQRHDRDRARDGRPLPCRWCRERTADRLIVIGTARERAVCTPCADDRVRQLTAADPRARVSVFRITALHPVPQPTPGGTHA